MHRVRDWIENNRAVSHQPVEIRDRSDVAAGEPVTGVFAPIAAELAAAYPDDYAYALALRNYRANQKRGLLTPWQRRQMRYIEIQRTLWEQMSG
jgi:hypothetical protein